MISFSQVHAWEVIEFNQGNNHLGQTIVVERSNTQMALGSPEIDNLSSSPINFVSLGFGGKIILKLEESFEVTPTSIMIVYETTYNYTACNTYPEKADIYISKDNIDYVYLGQQCINNNNTFNLNDSELDEFSYIKIVDVSDVNFFNRFSFTSDGFDVDGITIYDNGALPIVLKYFNVKYDNKILNIRFITASESNTDKFIVQSSIDLETFENIVYFKGSGFSSTDRIYDKKLIYDPKSNITYFRLIEIDMNGDVHKYDVIPLETDNKQIEYYYYDLLGRRVNGNENNIIKIKSRY
jgi:hypothetical protein